MSFFPINPEQCDGTATLTNPFRKFEEEYFEAIFESLPSNDKYNDLTLESGKLRSTVEDNLSRIYQIPTALQYIVQDHLEPLAIYYEIMWSRMVQQMLKNIDRDNQALTVDFDIAIQRLGSMSDKQAQISKNHIETAKNHFFDPDENIGIGSIDLRGAMSLYALFGLFDYSACWFDDAVWRKPIKDLTSSGMIFGETKYSSKFTILNHPFVYAVNCAFLHRQIFVLALDTKGDFIYLTKRDGGEKKTKRFTIAETHPHLADLLSGKVSMETYVEEFATAYEGMFQRDKIQMSQILYGLHVESRKQVTEYIYNKWRHFIMKKANEIIGESITQSDNRIKLLAEASTTTSFGWS